ncbi:MAG: HPr family phosphocarrier protein [bacterium]
MEEQVFEKTFEIKNKLGLHARPAALFVQTSNRFKAQVKVIKDGEEVNGKSIMGLMMLAAEQGSKLVIRVSGEDSEILMTKLEELILRKFDEE